MLDTIPNTNFEERASTWEDISTLYGLSEAETAVCKAIIVSLTANTAYGTTNHSYSSVCAFLGISESTVKTHMSNIYSKVLRNFEGKRPTQKHLLSELSKHFEPLPVNGTYLPEAGD